MPKEPTQKGLERVRPPRVHIAYQTTVGAAVEQRELPFVIGVLGDFSGLTSSRPRPRLKDRQFITVDWDNFNEVLASLEPRACFKIPTSSGGDDVDIDVTFSSIDDFQPTSLSQRIEALRALRQSDSPEALDVLRGHLDHVLHASAFQELEAAWRGLWYLLSRTETSNHLKVRLLDVSKNELLRDLQRAAEPDQSVLFKKMYEEPLGQFAGEPFGLFIGNFAFTSAPADIALLDGMASISARCLAPFIAGGGAGMFEMESFAQVTEVRDLARVFQTTAYAAWNRFRQSVDARYVGLTVPRMLLRSPYGPRPATPGEFQYGEDASRPDHLLWGNAAYALGACIANAFALYGWCGAIRGLESGGLVEGLPTWVHELEGGAKLRFSAEVLITDRREKEFADLGFIPLVHCMGTDYAAFFSVQSCMRPAVYDSDAASVNSRLSCQLQYVLTSSRFLHYLKVIARDRIGAYHTRGDWERLLNEWISQYVLTDDQASPAIRARFPLREARIDVVERVEKPGVYGAVVFLRPHFQLDELSVSLRFVTDLN